MYNKFSILVYIPLVCIVLLYSCRGDEIVYPSIDEAVSTDLMSGGLYILNEGNMGSNKAQIDYMNLKTGIYTRNFYGKQNPTVVKELGDVGNDIKIYGNKLYAVINCSHKVEIMDLTCRSITHIDIPNCRYLACANGHVYVSAYVGSIANPDLLGAVYEIDTTNMQIIREAQAGLQPDELVVTNNKIYVCNSGGYITDRFDSTISVIDVETFKESRKIIVGTNPHRIRIDKLGRLWVSCRGNYKDISPSLVLIENEQVQARWNIRADNMSLYGNELYLLDADNKQLHILDVQTLIYTLSPITTQLANMEKPYGLLAHNNRIFITDAKNYVSSGTIFCFQHNGTLNWQSKTGDIPAHICPTTLEYNVNNDEQTYTKSAYISKVYEYYPAPGQFVNVLPSYEQGDDYDSMCRKCEAAICGKGNGLVTLGGWGGYITFGFDHSVNNVQGEYDFRILGNAFQMTDNKEYGSSEPGIVMVSRDDNNNGIPDDTWYELAGSEYTNNNVIHNYTLTYSREADTIRNPFHSQPYYPEWYAEKITFSGSLLPSYTTKINGQTVQRILDYGYADNRPNTDTIGTSFDISWAVDNTGHSISLPSIDFIRVYTAIKENNDMAGELSTEIAGAIDLHINTK